MMKGGATDYLVKGIFNSVLLERPIRYALQQQRLRTERKQAEQAREQTLQRLRKAMEATVKAITLMSEMGNPHIVSHQEHVAFLATAIAKKMGLSEEQTEGVRVSAFLHDIGMIVVPGRIRTKLTELNEYDRKTVATHPEAGYDILAELDFPWPVAEAVLQHHERLDGSGYPAGLTGDQIILQARILAVADVVEAMSSYRPYRPPNGVEKAMKQLSDNRGILYDAQVVDACLKLLVEDGFGFEQATKRGGRG
jgi:putative nucleotidyltransferase with HDIG domain